jgi:hypothetical protein
VTTDDAYHGPLPPAYTWRVALSGLVVLALIGALVVMLYFPNQPGRAAGSAPAAGISPVRATPALDTSTDRGSLIDAISDPVALRDAPGGRVVGRMAASTQFGSPRVVPVVRAVPGWLGVIVGELHNNRLGWIPARGAQLARVSYSILVRTRSHTLTVFKDGRVLRTMPAAVGRPDLATPAGRFGVTDKLQFHPASAAYGCCALALSAHQYQLAPDWTGQNLVAIHSTPDEASVGHAVSHGCVRVTVTQGRWLLATIPLGTLVTVRGA